MNFIQGRIWLLGVCLESRWSDRYLYDAKTDSVYEAYSFKQRNCARAAEIRAMQIIGLGKKYQNKLTSLTENLLGWIFYGIYLLRRDDALVLISDEGQTWLNEVDEISRETILKQKRTKHVKFLY